MGKWRKLIIRIKKEEEEEKPQTNHKPTMNWSSSGSLQVSIDLTKDRCRASKFSLTVAKRAATSGGAPTYKEASHIIKEEIKNIHKKNYLIYMCIYGAYIHIFIIKYFLCKLMRVSKQKGTSIQWHVIYVAGNCCKLCSHLEL